LPCPYEPLTYILTQRTIVEKIILPDNPFN